MDTDIRGRDSALKVSGVPQSRQKPRSASSELMNTDSVPRVTRKLSVWEPAKDPKKFPNCFWHIRQWQIPALSGRTENS